MKKWNVHIALPAIALVAAPLLLNTARATDQTLTPKANGVAAARTVIDKETGRLRAPEHDEPSPAAAPAANARSVAPQSALRSQNTQRFQQQQIHGKDGAETMRLDMRQSLRFSVARRGVDGKLTKDCVVGEDAAVQRLTQPAPLAQGGSHE